SILGFRSARAVTLVTGFALCRSSYLLAGPCCAKAARMLEDFSQIPTTCRDVAQLPQCRLFCAQTQPVGIRHSLFWYFVGETGGCLCAARLQDWLRLFPQSPWRRLRLQPICRPKRRLPCRLRSFLIIGPAPMSAATLATDGAATQLTSRPLRLLQWGPCRALLRTIRAVFWVAFSTAPTGNTTASCSGGIRISPSLTSSVRKRSSRCPPGLRPLHPPSKNLS